MKPLEERLNDRLEQAGWGIGRNGQHAGGFTLPVREREHDAEVDELVALARRLQQAHPLRVAPDFARHLERRMVRRYAELQLQRESRRRSFCSLLRARPALSAVLGICLLFCLLSTSVLALAAQVSDPTSPLYGLKRWEQHVQLQFSGSPVDQATLDLQFARDRLTTLSSLADPVHTEVFLQALSELDQQLNSAASAINGLPPGSQHNQIAKDLISLKSDTVRVLRGLLARLALPERLATTDELARLGASVPHLISGTLTLPAQSTGHATISIAGNGIQPGAQLLVDGKPSGVTGTLQSGQMNFTLNWNGNQHPQSLGILNPDGTAAQITTIHVKTTGENGNKGSTKNSNSGNGNGSGSDTGNGNGNKPTVTPTAHKPTVTPTPNKPIVTPTPHQ